MSLPVVMNTLQELLSPKGWLVFEGMGSFCFPLWWLEGALCKGDNEETLWEEGTPSHTRSADHSVVLVLQLGHFFSLKQYLMFLQVVILWSQGVDHVNLGPGT